MLFTGVVDRVTDGGRNRAIVFTSISDIADRYQQGSASDSIVFEQFPPAGGRSLSNLVKPESTDGQGWTA